MQYNQPKIATLAISKRIADNNKIAVNAVHFDFGFRIRFCTENPNHKIIEMKWIHISLPSWSELKRKGAPVGISEMKHMARPMLSENIQERFS